MLGHALQCELSKVPLLSVPKIVYVCAYVCEPAVSKQGKQEKYQLETCSPAGRERRRGLEGSLH